MGIWESSAQRQGGQSLRLLESLNPHHGPTVLSFMVLVFVETGMAPGKDHRAQSSSPKASSVPPPALRLENDPQLPSAWMAMASGGVEKAVIKCHPPASLPILEPSSDVSSSGITPGQVRDPSSTRPPVPVSLPCPTRRGTLHRWAELGVVGGWRLAE